MADIKAPHEVRARWLGHRVHADVVIEVEPKLSVRETDKITYLVDQSLQEHIPLLGSAVVKVRAKK